MINTKSSQINNGDKTTTNRKSNVWNLCQKHRTDQNNRN